MALRNGYFQIENRSDGVYVVIYAPIDGGKKVNVAELSAFLEKKAISGFDIAELNSFIQSVQNNSASIKVSEQPVLEFNESISLKVSADRMTVVARFYPPSPKGSVMGQEEIIGALKQNNIQHGIIPDIIKRFTIVRPYCTDILVAKGTPPVQGKDASITYNFDANPTRKPKQLEDGSVDFHELNIFTKVQKGDLLATLTPAVQGTPGSDVFGNPILPAKVKNLALKHSRNITLSEDRLHMYSEVSGDVKLEGDTVFVSDTYYVPADVDASTGDITYDGNVVVTGNVRTGFTIRAKGSVQVNGVVEAAKIYSGDSIVLKRGMQGMSKGYLEAENDIVAKFVESGTLAAKNNITVGSLLHCKVKAGNDIVVSGRKAFIIGGEVEAGHMIDTRSVGNLMETVTVLRAGVSKEQTEKIQKLTEQNNEIQENISKYKQIMEVYKVQIAKGVKFSPAQINSVRTVGENLKQLETQFQNNTAAISELQDVIESSATCEIRVSDVANIGTEIYLNGNRQSIKEDIRRCRFKLNRGIIERVSY